MTLMGDKWLLGYGDREVTFKSQCLGVILLVSR